MTIINNFSGKNTVISGGTVTNIEGPLRNVTIINGKIYVEGIPYEEYQQKNNKIIHITVNITGHVDRIEDVAEVNVTGTANTVKSRNGNVKCGNVNGNVESHNGNITCGTVYGDCESHNGNIIRR